MSSPFPVTPSSRRSAASPSLSSVRRRYRSKSSSTVDGIDIKNREINSHNNNKGYYDPLIPESYADVATQRLYLLSIFALIQGLKIWDLVLLHREASTSSELSFACKYLFLDGLYLWLLPVFRVPWLTFRPSVTMIQILLCSLLTMFLSSRASVPFLAMLGLLWRSLTDKELSISESKVRVKDFARAGSHIGGKYVVHILPESTARLNPFEQPFCLTNNTLASVSIPVRLNSTEPSLIQVAYYPIPNVEGPRYLNFTKKEFKPYTGNNNKLQQQRPQDRRISYIELPVSSPGLYRLHKVIDKSGSQVRLYRVDVLVVSCPSAYIIGGNEHTDGHQRCVGDIEQAKLMITGVPPLRVKYNRAVKGRSDYFSAQSIQPEQFQSPLLLGPLPRSGTILSDSNSHRDKSLEWATPQTVSSDLVFSLSMTGSWAYQIDEIEDGLGNVVNFTMAASNKALPGLSFEKAILESQNLRYEFQVHARPQIRLLKCDLEHPLRIAKGKTAQIPLQITGDVKEGPFHANIEFTPEGDEVVRPQIRKVKFKSLRDHITVDRPGTLRITELLGSFCPGTVLEPSACLVLVPSEPTLTVEFEDIQDKCVGSIGMTADLTLSGSPPYHIHYRIIKDGKVDVTKLLQVDKSRHQLQFRPADAGSYVYEFFAIDDFIYKGVSLEHEKLVAQQTIKVLATAGFVERNPRRRCCASDTVSFDVDFHGQGPFKLTYEIIKESKRKLHTVSGIEGSRFTITTPPLSRGGPYTLTLVSVEDANGCKSMLDVEDAHIDVRREKPQAGFLPLDGKLNVRTLRDRQLDLPVALNGEAPFTLTYRFYPFSDQEKKIALGEREVEEQDKTAITKTIQLPSSKKASITVSDAGLYEIVDIRDAYCPGAPKKTDNKFEVSWVPLPEISIPESQVMKLDPTTGDLVRQPICESDEDSLEISLSGTAPFSVFYTRYDGISLEEGSSSSKDGETSIKESKLPLQLLAVTRSAHVRMESSRAGHYRYQFNKVSDSIYSEREMDKFARLSNDHKRLIIQQTVYRRPNAAFADPGQVYRTYVNINPDVDPVDPITVELTGKPPFTLTLNVRHESNGLSEKMTISNINDNIYNINSIYSNLGLGRHLVMIDKVGDSRGCMQDQLPLSQRVIVYMADVPTISSTEHKTSFCVGDRVSFTLTGIPPFEVEYDFNGKLQKATTGSHFSRVASKPGNFSIVSISDYASTGKVKIEEVERKKDLSLYIHEIPSVFISQGTNVELDIHEGDQAKIVFNFDGTPPFSFTYTRSERVPNNRGGRGQQQLRVVETHTVSDVEDYTYTIFTSMEGVYEAIAVEDAYCSARSS